MPTMSPPLSLWPLHCRSPAPRTKAGHQAAARLARAAIHPHNAPSTTWQRAAPEPDTHYAATLLDSACGCAVHSRLGAEQGYTTLELKIAYHRPLTAGSGRVRAEGRVLSIGRRAAFAEAKLVDAEGRLCASATSTLLVFDLPKEA